MLFTRKAQAVKKPDTPVKEETTVAIGGLLTTDSNAKMLKKTGRGKRNTNRRSVESGDGAGASTSGGAAMATSLGGAALLPGASSLDRRRSPSGAINGGGADVTGGSFRTIPDSFRVYRAQENRGLSDSEGSQLSFTGSTCSSCSGFDDSDENDDSGSDFG